MSKSISIFGNEFPVSWDIRSLLNKCQNYKGVKRFIRSLSCLFFLYEDSSYMVLPVKFLQVSKNCKDLSSFLTGQLGECPSGVLISKDGSDVLEIGIIYEPVVTLLVFYENFTYSTINFQGNEVEKSSPIPIGINEGKLLSFQFSYPYMLAYLEMEGSICVYLARFIRKEKLWSVQCKIPSLSRAIVRKTSLYFLLDDGLYGCSLDETGQRKFARPLSPVYIEPHLHLVHSMNFLFVFSEESQELIQVENKSLTKIPIGQEIKTPSDVFTIGPIVFFLMPYSIITFSLITRDIEIIEIDKKTQKWIISLDPSFGAALLGEISFSISKADLPPCINLQAGKESLLNQMRKVKEETGTVAASLLLLSSRSPYIASTLLEEEIKNEISSNPQPGSIQEYMKPALTKLYSLLKERPA